MVWQHFYGDIVSWAVGESHGIEDVTLVVKGKIWNRVMHFPSESAEMIVSEMSDRGGDDEVTHPSSDAAWAAMSIEADEEEHTEKDEDDGETKTMPALQEVQEGELPKFLVEMQDEGHTIHRVQVSQRCH